MNRRNNKPKQWRKKIKRRPMRQDGTDQLPPKMHGAQQVPDGIRVRDRIEKRVVSTIFSMATNAAGNFATGVNLPVPGFVTSGTLTSIAAMNATNIVNAYALFRIKRVQVKYTPSIALTTAVSPIYGFYDPTAIASTYGSSSATNLTDSVNFQNRFSIDPRYPDSFTIRLKNYSNPVTSVAIAGPVSTQGGWFDTAYFQNFGAAIANLAGTLALTYTGGPNSTTLGVFEFNYLVDLKGRN